VSKPQILAIFFDNSSRIRAYRADGTRKLAPVASLRTVTKNVALLVKRHGRLVWTVLPPPSARGCGDAFPSQRFT